LEVCLRVRGKRGCTNRLTSGSWKKQERDRKKGTQASKAIRLPASRGNIFRKVGWREKGREWEEENIVYGPSCSLWENSREGKKKNETTFWW